MALPKITHPVFKIKIPSTKKVLNFRPYTVKEEKLLLIMNSSEDTDEIIDTLKQIINNCCVESIDTDKLAMFDIEYIFIKLRSKSVSEELELNYSLNGERYKFFVNLEEVEVKINPAHTNKLILHNDIGVVMKYPSFHSIIRLEKEYSEPSKDVELVIFDMFIDSIESVFDNTKVYKDFTRDELEEFVLSLPKKSMDKVKEFFDTIPVLEHKVKIKLKDGTDHEIVMSGLKDFFIF